LETSSLAPPQGGKAMGRLKGGVLGAFERDPLSQIIKVAV
jgi:hypothetical protein